MSLDFTMTALVRPEITRKCLESFKQNLIGAPLRESRLFINIDPIPSSEHREEVVALAQEYFREVIFSLPSAPNFSAAIKWCWSKPSSDYFFHLEDDWLLLEKIDFFKIPLDPSVSCYNLKTYNFPDGNLFLSPGLWRTSDAKYLAEQLSLELNPEKQLREGPIAINYQSFKGAFYPNHSVLFDLGRQWALEKGWIKNGKWEKFTRLIKSDLTKDPS